VSATKIDVLISKLLTKQSLTSPLSRFWLAIFAVFTSCFIAVIGIAADWSFASPRRALRVSDLILVSVTSLLLYGVLVFFKAREQALTEQMRIIAEMNHHIRNALSVITLSVYLTENQEVIWRTNTAVERIDWALREILPGKSHDGLRPHRGRRILFEVLLTLVFVALIGLLDYATGPDLSLYILYFGPVCYAAWFIGQAAGIGISFASGATWLIANKLAGLSFSHPQIIYWNALVRLGSFIFVVALVSALRKRLRFREACLSEAAEELAALVPHKLESQK
jgi:hypothetical protein